MNSVEIFNAIISINSRPSDILMTTTICVKVTVPLCNAHLCVYQHRSERIFCLIDHVAYLNCKFLHTFVGSWVFRCDYFVCTVLITWPLISTKTVAQFEMCLIIHYVGKSRWKTLMCIKWLIENRIGESINVIAVLIHRMLCARFYINTIELFQTTFSQWVSQAIAPNSVSTWFNAS